MDFHGQHDHQLLLDPATHINTLDQLAKTAQLKDRYAELFVEYAALKKDQDELRALETGRERELDLLKFQMDELLRVEPQPDEDIKLKEEHIRLANTEKLHEQAAQVIQHLMKCRSLGTTFGRFSNYKFSYLPAGFACLFALHEAVRRSSILLFVHGKRLWQR